MFPFLLNKRIYLSNKNEEGELVFIINQLKENRLVLIIDDPSDSDAQYLKIHFKVSISLNFIQKV